MILVFVWWLPEVGIGQNVQGVWEGYLDQTKEAQKTETYKHFEELGLWKKGEKTHKLVLTFEQTAEEFKGLYRISSYGDSRHFAEFEMQGYVRSEIVDYITTKRIYEVKRPTTVFCFTKGNLRYSRKGEYEYLKGTMEGWVTKDHPCAGAVIQVRRKIKKEEDTHPEMVLGRNTVVRKKFTTREEQINLHVWDANRVDGDSITLIVNGEKILEHHMITKDHKGLTIPLRKGKNHVVLHAENMGKTPPNTAAVEVIAGDKRKTIILSSDSKKSEAIQIKRK